MTATVLRRFSDPLTFETLAAFGCSAYGVVVKVDARSEDRCDHHTQVSADPDLKMPQMMGHKFPAVYSSSAQVFAKIRAEANIAGWKLTSFLFAVVFQALHCRTAGSSVIGHDDVRFMGFLVNFNAAFRSRRFVTCPSGSALCAARYAFAR